MKSGIRCTPIVLHDFLIKKHPIMFSKRARVDTDDLEDVRLRRSSNNTQLRRLIHEQLAMLNTSELSTHDRLQSIIAEQRTWLETPECDDVENTRSSMMLKTLVILKADRPVVGFSQIITPNSRIWGLVGPTFRA